MSASGIEIQIEVVVETPWFEAPAPWPWPIAEIAPFTHLRVWSGMTEPEIGTALAALVDHNHLDEAPPEDWFAALLECEEIAWPGGLRLSQGERTVRPGCCSGLEYASQWRRDLDAGTSPWMGHDPAPWIEFDQEARLVRQDGGLDRDRPQDPVDLRTTRTALDRALADAERDLRDFLDRARGWMVTHRIEAHDPVMNRITQLMGLEAP